MEKRPHPVADVNAIDLVVDTEAAEGAELTRGWTLAVDRAIGLLVDPICAALLLIEIIILTGGVVSRYVFHNPISWTDNVATSIFLWLTMLGSVAAFRHGEHMRLAAFVRTVSPNTRATLDIIALVIVALFCIELLPATATLYELEKVDLTPALGYPRSYEVAAVFAGLALIFVLAVLRLIDRSWKKVLPIVVIAVAVSAAAVSAHSLFPVLGNWNLVLFFVVVVGCCVTIGVPIAFAFGFGALSYLELATTVPLSTVVDRMEGGITNLVLLAIPLFVLLGVLIEGAGIARRIVEALASLVGHFRGGLNFVLILAMYLVSGISGSKTADMAAVAPALFPEMERRGQERHEMIALLATSAAMAETIPPSLVLIIIGTVVGVSIRDLFTAGLLPAAIMAIALMIVSRSRSKADRTEFAVRATARQIGAAFFVAIPGLLLPFVIRFCVVAGVATATEVSTIGIMYSVFVGLFVYREFDWRRAYPMLVHTARLSGTIMLIIAMATAMGWSLTQSGFAQQLANILAHAGGPIGFMALSIVLFTILGSLLEGIPAIVLFGPLLFPIAKTLGISDVHYAIVVVFAMGLGLFAPPVGIGYYAACAIGKTEPHLATRPIVPYLLALLIVLLLIAAVPWISLGFLSN